MRLLIGLAAAAVLGCSATDVALFSMSTAMTTQTLNAAAEQDAQRQREAEKERAHQQSQKCCATKEYIASQHTWRCTACDG